MESIGALLKLPQEKKDPNLRRQLMKELYTLYENQKENRRKENWKRYCVWLRASQKRNTPESVRAYKRTRGYIRELAPSSFSILLATIKTNDLYWAISEIKNGKTFGWLFWSCKAPKELGKNEA